MHSIELAGVVAATDTKKEDLHDVLAETPKNNETSEEKHANLHVEDVIGMIGRVDFERLHVAEALHQAIPRPLLDAVHETERAGPLIYLLLMHRGAACRKKRLTLLRERSAEAETVAAWLPLLDKFSPQSRIPLVQMAAPSLKRLSKERYEAFRATVEKLIATGGRLDLFEYAVRALLLRTLDIHFGLQAPIRHTIHGIRDIAEPYVLVLSHLTHSSYEKAEIAEAAFRAGLKGSGIEGTLLSRKKCTAKSWNAALRELLPVIPELKRRLLTGLIDCICHDGIVTARKGELIRAICAMLDSPIPMLGAVHNRTDIYDISGERETEID